ncbi:MAG: patatin-like phospholipase family protein [Desulfuromonadaceae bacterium]
MADATGKRIGLALGSGSARGWSHIGIIQTLEEMGIVPDVVCGSSIGAVVGAAYAAQRMEALQEWAESLTRMDVASFFNLKFHRSGFIDIERLQRFLSEVVDPKDSSIENLSTAFATVATDLESGSEYWFTQGGVRNAVRGSMSLPGLFTPLRHEERWLVDGGLVNPIPVSVCKSLGAEFVIAVNLNGDIVGKHSVRRRNGRIRQEKMCDAEKRENQERKNSDENHLVAYVKNTLRSYSDSLFSTFGSDQEDPPGLFETLAGSVNITQDRITRTRLKEDKPDIVIAPKLAHIGLLEFYRAHEAIVQGHESVKQVQESLEDKLVQKG